LLVKTILLVFTLSPIFNTHTHFMDDEVLPQANTSLVS